MSSTSKNSGRRQACPETVGVTPGLLRAEISFWHEMIRLRGETMSDASLERMHQALALAQCKLAQSEGFASPLETSPQQPADNVCFIKRY
jgi:hypothetical protein